MEYLQVFNNKKEKLNEKILRRDKNSLPSGKYFMVVLIFIQNSEEKFLIQKTSKEKESLMATTGGHVSYGDDGITTIIKEVKEELGYDLNINEIEYVDTTSYPNGLLETYYLKKDIDISKLIIQKEEVEYVDWYTLDEIKEFIKNNEFRKANIEPLEKVLKYIDKD